MKSLHIPTIFVSISILALSAACGPAIPPQTPTAAATPTTAPSATPSPEPTPTLEPEALLAAFIKAVQSDDIEAAAAYMAAGADVNAAGEFGLTAIDIAASRNNPAMVRLLLDEGAEWQIETLHAGITSGSLEVVTILVDEGADLNARSGRWGFHALLFAAQHGHVELGQYLIANGADVYLGDNYGDPALNVAAYFGQLEFVTMLLEMGVNVNTPNSAGRTALDHALSQKHADVEAVLRAAGAAE